jgi:DNA-directed RNA polymerase specialized sigma24 family protein
LSQSSTAETRDRDNSELLPALTHNGYTRSEAAERDILALTRIGAAELLAAFAVGEGQPGYRTSEALVFFTRRAHRLGETLIRDRLFALLTARCQVYFRGAVRGFEPQARMDVQQEVLLDLARLLLADDDRGDFLECRFLTYLKRETARARGRMRQKLYRAPLIGDITEDDDAADVFVANHRHEQDLAAADRARVRELVASLPEALRDLVILRYFGGWQIGDERNQSDDETRMTLAKRFDVTPRTIQNRLARAYTMMFDTWKDDQ